LGRSNVAALTRGGCSGKEDRCRSPHTRCYEDAATSYSKGVLVQAKRVGRDEMLGKREYAELIDQCDRMLAITPSAFVFDYTKYSMRCGAATRISGSSSRDLHRTCGWTSYRFFLELFRCPIGDPRITSALVDELPASWGLEISAKGQLTEKERAIFE
jgi:hypothetical protein